MLWVSFFDNSSTHDLLRTDGSQALIKLETQDAIH